MCAEQTNYRSFLLRLWQEGSHSEWRAALQDVITGQRQHFATLDALTAFLHGQAKPNDPGCKGKDGQSTEISHETLP